MATIKYFSGEIELKAVQGMKKAEFAATFPGVVGRRLDSFEMMVGYPVDEVPVFDQVAKRWLHTILPIDRVVEFKSQPSRHECDARCINATGRVMRCECSCGGKNHGRGAFNCSAVAA